jgi:hypothetical protein
MTDAGHGENRYDDGDKYSDVDVISFHTKRKKSLPEAEILKPTLLIKRAPCSGKQLMKIGLILRPFD